MRGRPPKPTAIKELSGTKRNYVEPKATRGTPPKPKNLNEVASKEWDRICQALDELQLLSTADAATIELYCKAWSHYQAAGDKVEKEGYLVIHPKSKMPIQNPYWKILIQSEEQVRRYLVEFGLTPAARARMRIEVSKKEMKKNKWQGLVA